MSGVDSTYLNGGFNPYLSSLYSKGFDTNADYMSSASGLNNQALQNYQQSLLGNQTAFAGYPQLTQDKFEKSGTSTRATAVGLGLGAGTLATAGIYKLGGDYVNPFKDNKFDDKFLKAVEEDHTAKIEELYKKAKQEALTAKKITYNESQITSLRKIAELGPDEARKNGYTVKGKWTKDRAAAKVKEIDEALATVSKDRIKANYLAEHSLDGTVSKMNEFVKQRSLIEGMKDGDSLVDLIKKNPKTFGITETAEAEIASKAEELARTYGGNKAAAKTYIGSIITTQQGHIDTVRNKLIEAVKGHYNETTNSLKESAPPELQKAFKSFKFRKAGLAGLIAAGAGLLLGYTLGGNKS